MSRQPAGQYPEAHSLSRQVFANTDYSCIIEAGSLLRGGIYNRCLYTSVINWTSSVPADFRISELLF